MPTLELMLLLFAVAVAAGCLDTLAGGGGLLVLPALILAGVPPLEALGTNKMQGAMGTATAATMMLRHGKVNWPPMRPMMTWAFVGSGLGSIAVQFVDADLLRYLIPVVLVLIAGYFLLSGRILAVAQPARMDPARFRRSVIPGIGLYDGMIGPGTGSFFSLAIVTLQGKPLLDATAQAKCLNFATNLASLLVFLSAGKLVWQIGLLMMVGQAIGAWVGSHLLFRSNPQLLRLLIVATCLGMLLRYFLGS
ncbi:MAG TPA: TSUP family transporter [Hyphomicrobiales bacterium]|nr:TSUP family transporter [Hyphomicrobiales bacterium]